MGSCGTCSAQLITDSFNCPDCNSVVIDMASDTRTDDQIAAAVMQAYPCLKCQKHVYLKEVVSCDSCKEPKQNNLADVVLHGMRQGEGKNSKLVLQKFEKTDDFEKRVKGQLGGKSLAALIADLGKPYEFDAILAPRDLPSQAKRLELSGVNLPSANPQTPTQGFMGPGHMGSYPPPPVAGAAPMFTPPPSPFSNYPSNTPTFGPPSDTQVGPTPFVPPPLPNFQK
jgi:hypothetical protein